ncbi:MAG: hypothetical protein E4G93_01730 [Dehalococcoidia bacterium]|nr:MAG: hypothetical protein E4G93_01730 [Dehalococcoidia bacterium]
MRFSNILGDFFGKKSGSEKISGSRADSPSGPLTPADLARQEKLRQSAASHHGILNEEFAKTLERADEGLKFPEAPDDPLAYLGNIELLGLSSEERKVVREWTRELLEEKGAHAVWNSRLRLKLELRYLATESGLHKGIGRFPGDRAR